VQVLIDGVNESDFSRQRMNGADSAVGESLSAVGDLVVNVDGGKHRPLHPEEVVFIEPSVVASLAVEQLSRYLESHSKSSGSQGGWVWVSPDILRNTPKDFEFFLKSSPANLAGTIG
jgi:hypothetical protein